MLHSSCSELTWSYHYNRNHLFASFLGHIVTTEIRMVKHLQIAPLILYSAYLVILLQQNPVCIQLVTMDQPKQTHRTLQKRCFDSDNIS